MTKETCSGLFGGLESSLSGHNVQSFSLFHLSTGSCFWESLTPLSASSVGRRPKAYGMEKEWAGAGGQRDGKGRGLKGSISKDSRELKRKESDKEEEQKRWEGMVF